MNKVLATLGFTILVIAAAVYFYFSGREYVITIPEAEIAEKLQHKLPMEKTYLLIFKVTLDNPRVDLVAGNNRINLGLDVQLNIHINGDSKPLGGKLDASGSLKYVPEEGAFYLVDPVIENLALQGVPEKHIEKASKVIQQALVHFYSTRPVYKLKHSDIKQSFTRLVLKSLEVKDEAVVVTLGI